MTTSKTPAARLCIECSGRGFVLVGEDFREQKCAECAGRGSVKK